jgi:hypothetical protein
MTEPDNLAMTIELLGGVALFLYGRRCLNFCV